jgi:hypothetical protein
MPDITHIGTITDTECRVIHVQADSGHIRLDAFDRSFLTVSDANRLCHHLIGAMNTAIDQGLTEAIEYTLSDEEPEPGGATSAWEHHRHG